MPKFKIALVLAGATFVLSGCSVFYPNWGATSLPQETSESQSATSESPTAEPSETESQAPAEETTEPEPSPTETIQRKKVDVEIIMAIPEPSVGVLTVVAQVLDVSESGGKCTLKFIGGSEEKSMVVSAEPSSDYTQCFPIEYPLDELPSGNGVVTVSYESEGHFGTSAPVSVVIE